MRLSLVYILFFATICFCNKSNAQQDTAILTLADLPAKYFKEVDKKIDKYSNRITSKTEKTLTKLSRWENKIKNLLQKANPEAANRLFGPGKITFSLLLEQLKKGKSIAENQTAEYNDYKDKLSTGIKYLQSKKSLLDSSLIKPLNKVTGKMSNLDETMANTEAVEKFVKERKKQLMDESLKYIGKSKYLSKINKESYYYVETLRNYKELFKDKKKAEETAMKVLNQIPAFQKYVKENSALASLFGIPSNYGDLATLNGLQTRSGVNEIITQRILAGGPNALEQIQQNIQEAQSALTKLKDNILNIGGNGGSFDDVPNFKPDMTRTKTLKQRIVYGINFQFGRTNNFMPSTADIGLTMGYKINDKSTVGVGGSLKLGMGTIDRIRFSSQGANIRSFLDWKIKKQFYITGGFEMNYLNLSQVRDIKVFNNWQQSGVVGISKKISMKTKKFKGGKLQLLYDFFNRQHTPVSQPVIFRTGFEF